MRVKIVAKFWWMYFIFSIAVLGFGVVFLTFFPLVFLARWIPSFRGLSERALQKGVQLLFWVQPWLRADVDISLPVNREGLLLVSNHRSHLDVFILLFHVPGVRILAKSSLFKIPFLSLMMKATRQIGVERGRIEAWVKAMETVRERLVAGETVHIFPEMTRCEPGFEGVQNFTSAPFLIAIQEKITVLPVVFKNTDGVWPKGQIGVNYGVPITVKTLPPIEAATFTTADELKREVRRQMQEALA